ncbi:MAG: hypothetical protein U0412_06320 [Nitrospira sp.]|mgnify:CR=1 FL=1
MSILHWIARLYRSIVQGMTPKVSNARRLHRIKSVAVALGSSLAVPALVWAGGEAPKPVIAAAGFGYQVGEVSTITVKIYNPQTGEVLSDESYELNVKEDQVGKSTGPQERIFAGGVGPGATDLSNFVLRVYDAKTGKFQWEGNLNLTPVDSGNVGQLVSTVTPRRATVTQVATKTSSGAQPSFLLRALDPETGGLVWEDEFSTDGQGRLRTDRIAYRPVATDDLPAELPHTFDFRIRMVDAEGRHVVWEDRFAQTETEEAVPAESIGDAARALPTWPDLSTEAERQSWI